MVRLRRRTICLALGAAAIGRAGWESKPRWTKPVSEWGDRDVESILTASPWARSVAINLTPPSALPRPAASSDAGADLFDRDEKGHILQYVIRWDSAAPIQEALRRTRMRGPVYAPLTPEAVERYYVVSVIIVRPEPVDNRDCEVDAKQRDRIAGLTMLRRARHNDLHPCEVVGKRGLVLHQLRFSKEDPITPEDAHVEFRTLAVPALVRAIFPLDEMWFQGKLAV